MRTFDFQIKFKKPLLVRGIELGLAENIEGSPEKSGSHVKIKISYLSKQQDNQRLFLTEMDMKQLPNSAAP